MESRRWLAALELIVLLCVVEEEPLVGGTGKAFRLAVNSSDGSVLCAVSVASQSMSISNLPTPSHNQPPQVRCARHCTSQTPCHSFNYRSDNSSCQFYHYPPPVCQPVSTCQYFQVSLFQFLSIKILVGLLWLF